MKQNFKIFTYWILGIVIGCFVIANVPISHFNLTKYFVKPKLGVALTTISSTDLLSDFPNVNNANMTALNNAKLESGSSASLLTIASTTIGQLTTGFITSTSTATSTYSGGIAATRFNATSATSTFANGIIVTNGCVLFGGNCLGATTVTSVSNANGTLTISPTTGNVIASLALGNSNIWTSASTTFTTSFQAGSTTVDNLLVRNVVSIPVNDKICATATDPTGITSSTASSTILSCTIPGGTLGTNNAIHGHINIPVLKLASPSDIYIEMKYGGTSYFTIATTSALGISDLTNGRGYIDFDLTSGGTASSQEATMTTLLYGSWSPSIISDFQIKNNTSSVDSTIDQLLQIIVRTNFSSSGNVLTASDSHVFSIK